MQKIQSLFLREWKGDRLALPHVHPGSQWVQAGEGVATRKWDGTSCMFKGGFYYKRYDAKAGKTPPPNFIPAQEPDVVTGHWPGWVPVLGDNPSDKWHVEGLANAEEVGMALVDGTYELVGPKVCGNRDRFDEHLLIRHGVDIVPNVPRDFDGLKHFFEHFEGEGVVWHHPDGRMVKAKRRDFWK